MKYAFFNDTGRDLTIHPASKRGGGIVKAGSLEYSECPEGTIPLVKVWEDTVLLTYL